MKIPYAKPGTSIANKTGDWRSERPLVSDKCTACGICVRVCPDRCMELISRSGNPASIAKVDYDYCKGCGICANECPVKAIVMKREEDVKSEAAKEGEKK